MLGQIVQRSLNERSSRAPSAATLVRALAALNIAVVLLFSDGTTAWASPAALDALDSEDQARVIRPALRRLVREVSVAGSTRRARITRQSHGVRLRSGSYRFVAASLSAEAFEPSVAIAFGVEEFRGTISYDAMREQHRLTPQQARVAELLIQGHSNAVIAEQLGIKLSTARSHVEHVRRKLGVRTRAQVVARLVAAFEMRPIR